MMKELHGIAFIITDENEFFHRILRNLHQGKNRVQKRGAKKSITGRSGDIDIGIIETILNDTRAASEGAIVCLRPFSDGTAT